MTYIKINKDSLDYHQFANFHAYTMNNFVRNIMRNGKYKKAVKLARLGLLYGLKRVHVSLQNNWVHGIFKSFKKLRPTLLAPETQNKLKLEIKEQESVYKADTSRAKENLSGNIIEDERLLYYHNLTKQLMLINNIPTKKFSFFEYFNEIISKDEIEATFPSNFKKYLLDENYHILNSDIEPFNRLNHQYDIIQNKLQFKKIYTKKPHTYYFRTRNLTVFDMIIQAYTMLNGVWYMRKTKVSGRTVLVPSPLRPHRRITTVTQMLMKGIRQLRRSERYNKKAMIYSIGTEFFFLINYYGSQYKHGGITPSFVWQLKLQSHKELVANLKNIKHLNYF